MLVCILAQLLLSLLLVWDFTEERSELFAKLTQMPTSYWLVTARFICGVILHMNLQEELKSGFFNMKFALNHHYRFDDYKIAFLAGFCQATMIVVVESVNFLTILDSTSVLDIVMNFMALTIVSEFDDIVYGSLGDDKGKEVLHDERYESLFKITRTTSADSREQCEGNLLVDDTYAQRHHSCSHEENDVLVQD